MAEVSKTRAARPRAKKATSVSPLTRDLLARVPLFAGASDAVLNAVAEAFTQVSVAGGDVVCTEGEPGTTFHLVDTGTLVVESQVGAQRRELARIGPGDFFGEIALLGGGTRTATVTALSPSRLWTITATDFATLTAADDGVRAQVEEMARARMGRSLAAAFEVRHQTLGDTLARRGKVALGRAVDNDIVLPSRGVSAHHALIRGNDNGVVVIEDLGSTNGTFVNAKPITRAELHDGDEVWIADELFVFQTSSAGAELTDVVRPPGVRIDAIDLRKEVGQGVSLLAGVSLAVLPGELVALVGGSGAGKSTLLDALAGTRPATSGRVLYDGEDRYEHDARFRSIFGYVPQDDIVHTALSLRRTLRHAARIRLPADVGDEERDAIVDRVIEQLALSGQKDVKVANLSGGQRKRSSIGVELLTQPRAFFLDEPTSGLDPATDSHMMRLLRTLADAGSTVIVTTHATKNVQLCDKVVVLGRGGHLAFVGTPARALEHFRVTAFDEIYDRLEPQDAPQQAAEAYRASEEFESQQSLLLAPPPAVDGADNRRRKLRTRARHAMQQFFALSRRNLDIHLRNKDLLLPVVAQPIVLSVLLLALFESGVFKAGRPNATAPLQLVFLLAFNAFLLGLLSSVQEIVKELPIFRERSVGVGTVPYLLSKTTFLVPAVLAGCFIMASVVWATNRLPDTGWSMFGPLLLAMGMAGMAGMALALFTSSFVSSSQQATDMLSLWIMPQVLFGGGLFAVPSMNFAGRLISNGAPLRSAFEAAGHAVDMNGVFRRSGGVTGRSLLAQYGNSFSLAPTKQWLILIGFMVVPFTLAGLILRRRQSSR
jgi:ABC-type multidrug transport system ATPase subunit/CRP-like cAMP-binding protein